jgi:hypothetical protein
LSQQKRTEYKQSRLPGLTALKKTKDKIVIDSDIQTDVSITNSGCTTINGKMDDHHEESCTLIKENMINHHDTSCENENAIEIINAIKNKTSETRLENQRPLKKQIFEYPEDFERFWFDYPKKEAKGEAFKVFKTLLADDKAACIAGAGTFRRKWQVLIGDIQFVPQPAKWIRARRWEDKDLQTHAAALGAAKPFQATQTTLMPKIMNPTPIGAQKQPQEQVDPLFISLVCRSAFDVLTVPGVAIPKIPPESPASPEEIAEINAITATLAKGFQI